jgi:predicted kinase
MRTIMIMKGLPGSGKSRRAAEVIKKEPTRWVRINRDDLRGMAVGPGNNPYGSNRNEREDLVRNFKNELVRQAVREGFDVILDDTHLVPQTVKKLHALAMSIGDIKVIEVGINESVDTCIARDAGREGFARVGEKVIKDMARGAGIDKGRKLSDKEAYYPPRWAPGGEGAGQPSASYDPNSKLPSAVICDLDGTLAFLNGRSPYDASTCDQDPPNLPVIECVVAMYKAGHNILFTSGREDKYREPTVKFIEQWVRFLNEKSGVFFNGKQKLVWQTIPYHLFMRSSGDMRKDNIIKTELYDANIRDKFNVVFALDDRNQVVDNWREMGLACFQVAPGAF